MTAKYFVVERTAKLTVKQVTHLNCLRELLPAVTEEVAKLQLTARGCGSRLNITKVRDMRCEAVDAVKTLSFADTTHYWMQRGLKTPNDTSWYPVESGEWFQAFGTSVREKENGLQIPKLGVLPIEGSDLYSKLSRLIIPLDAKVTAEQKVYLLYKQNVVARRISSNVACVPTESGVDVPDSEAMGVDPALKRNVIANSDLQEEDVPEDGALPRAKSDVDVVADAVRSADTSVQDVVGVLGTPLASESNLSYEERMILHLMRVGLESLSRMEKLSEDVRCGAELLREALADEISAA